MRLTITLMLLTAHAGWLVAGAVDYWDINSFCGEKPLVEDAAALTGKSIYTFGYPSAWCNISLSVKHPNVTAFNFYVDSVKPRNYNYYTMIVLMVTEQCNNASRVMLRMDQTSYGSQMHNMPCNSSCYYKISLYQNTMLYYTFDMQLLVTMHRTPCPNDGQFYKCNSSECVASSLQCDGLRNCADNSDERPGCSPPSWWMTSTTAPSTTESSYYPVMSAWFYVLIGVAAFFVVLSIVYCILACVNSSNSMTMVRAQLAVRNSRNNATTGSYHDELPISTVSAPSNDDNAPPKYDAPPSYDQAVQSFEMAQV